MILAVDPDTRALAWALMRHDNGELLDGAVIRAHGLEDMLAKCDQLLNVAAQGSVRFYTIERPQLYGTQDRADPNKIGQLLTIGGRASAAFPAARLRLPFPADWKGQTPKNVHHVRVRAALSDESRARLDALLARVPKSLQHNLMDAVGLAQWTRSRR